jgi:hypothetical protein
LGWLGPEVKQLVNEELLLHQFNINSLLLALEGRVRIGDWLEPLFKLLEGVHRLLQINN